MTWENIPGVKRGFCTCVSRVRGQKDCVPDTKIFVLIFTKILTISLVIGLCLLKNILFLYFTVFFLQFKIRK
jgi:hypothetical protein